MSETQTTPLIDVRGHSILDRPASLKSQIFATLADLGAIFFLSTVVVGVMEITPSPCIKTLSIFLFIAVLYCIPQKLFLGITLGQKFWHLEIIEKKRLRERSSVSVTGLLTSGFFTLVTIGLTVYEFQKTVLTHPIWLKASLWNLEAYTPPLEHWQILPFFYSMGAFPKQFQGKPIFFSLPYEAAPPTHFLGHIVSHWTWDSTETSYHTAAGIRWIMEGPKTPEPQKTQTQIKSCFTQSLTYTCFSIKEAVLSRHIREIRNLSPQSWTLKWFQIVHSSLPRENQVQGIYLSANSGDWIEDRFIVIHPHGVHQTFILHRPNNALGEQAFNLAQKIIGSMRSFENLEPGKAWASQELEKIQLDSLSNIQDPLFLEEKFAEIQSLLISRISVDPASLDTYYHLAGTSLLFLKAFSTRNEPYPKIYSLKNIESSAKYSKDISQHDSKTNLIEDIWQDAQRIP